MNLSSHCATNRYLIFLIPNEYPCTLLLLRRLHRVLLLIYLVVYRIGLSNDVMRDAVLPYQRNDAITVP